MQRRKIIKEAFTRTSADILKSCFTNLSRRGREKNKDNLADEVQMQPAYKSMGYDDRADIDDVIAALPDGELQPMDFNRAVDRALGSATVASAPPSLPTSGKLDSVKAVEDYVKSLAAANPSFKPQQIGRGQVGGAYSAGSIAALSHGMGPVARTVTKGDAKMIRAPEMKTINQTYRPQMDPKNRHLKRAFSDVRVATGNERPFFVTPSYVDETSNLYDVYANEMVPEAVFYARQPIYTKMWKEDGTLPTPIQMQNLRRTGRMSESVLRKFITEFLKESVGAEPVEIDRNEYVTNQRKNDFVEDDELRDALAGTSFSNLKVINSMDGAAVNDFTHNPTGDKALALMRGINGELFFKVNTKSYIGSYYKIV